MGMGVMRGSRMAMGGQDGDAEWGLGRWGGGDVGWWDGDVGDAGWRDGDGGMRGGMGMGGHRAMRDGDAGWQVENWRTRDG